MGSLGEHLNKIGQAMASAASTFTSSMGDVGAIINSGMQGMMAGGPWGAIIAVIAELLVRLDGFVQFFDMLNAKTFESLGKLNTALAPLFDLLGQLSEMLEPVQDIIHAVVQFVITFLTPLFKALGEVFEGLGSILEMIVPVFETISSLFSSLTDAVSGIIPVFDILGGIFWVLSKVIGSGILFIMYIVKGLADLFGGDDAINAQVAKLEKMMMSEFKGPADAMSETTKQVVNLGDEAQKTADKFSEMLTNMPSGYKLRRQQFEAMGGPPGPEGAGNAAQSSAPGFVGSATNGPGGTSITITGPVNIGAKSLADFAKQISEAQATNGARRGRNGF